MAGRQKTRKRSNFDYAAYFREMHGLRDLTVLPQDRTWRAVPPTGVEPHQVVLYLGCNVLRTSHMIRTITDILDLLDVDYVAVGGPAYCCGIVHHRFGDTELSETIGRSAVRYLERFEPERVIMWCPSCIHFYDEIFQVPASFETQHVTEFLVDHLDEFEFRSEVRQRVTLHYHSNRERRLQEARAAGTLLSRVPGLDYVEIGSDARLDRSCSQFVQQALGMETWQQIIEGQLEQAAEAEVDIFATLYHGCQTLICPNEERFPMAIEHYLGPFARALGIEHEDRYKKYRLWRDPDRVLAEMAPCMTVNNVKPARAREIVERTFPSR